MNRDATSPEPATSPFFQPKPPSRGLRQWTGRISIGLNPFSKAFPKPFFAWVCVRYLLVALPVNYALRKINASGRTDFAGMSSRELFFFAVLIGPVVETLIFQSVFCGLARHLRLCFWWQIAVTMTPFTIAHFFFGVGVGVQAGLVLGYFLSYIYIMQRQTSFSSAFWQTAAFHIANNGVAIAIIALARHHAST